MNPLTRTHLMTLNAVKLHRLEADVERMADVLALIAVMAEGDPAPFTPVEALGEIARIARAALVSATPADPSLALHDPA